MQALVALEVFLSRALCHRRERYIEFAKKPKTRKKFLDAIYHDLERDLDPAYFVESLPSEISLSSGYVFQAGGQFGAPLLSLEELIASHAESCLAVSTSGQAGIYCPETHIDSRRYIVLRN